AGALAAVSDHSATEGSAVRQTVTLGAGESVSLDWNLLTDEPDQGDLDDFVAIVIDGELTLLASVHGASLVSGAGTVFDYQTGYQTYTFEPAQPGTYTIALVALDAGDTVVDSALLIDDVSAACTLDGDGDGALDCA